MFNKNDIQESINVEPKPTLLIEPRLILSLESPLAILLDENIFYIVFASSY